MVTLINSFELGSSVDGDLGLCHQPPPRVGDLTIDQTRQACLAQLKSPLDALPSSFPTSKINLSTFQVDPAATMATLVPSTMLLNSHLGGRGARVGILTGYPVDCSRARSFRDRVTFEVLSKPGHVVYRALRSSSWVSGKVFEQRPRSAKVRPSAIWVFIQ